MFRSLSMLHVVGALSLLSSACGGPTSASSQARAPTMGTSPATLGTVEEPSNVRSSVRVLDRSEVVSVVSQGLGAFLQRVELEDRPVLVHGAFRGFRIAALRGNDFWRGVDLRPGDVVTSVNGFPIERPEQAQAAFDSLQVASELRVSYEREGTPRELVYPIASSR